MSVFDQRNQKVTYQYNVNGSINFGSIKNITEVANTLNALAEEVQEASKAKVIDPTLAIDIESEIKKAAIETTQPSPSKENILTRLEKVKNLVGEVSALAGFIASIGQAIDLIKNLL